MAQNNEFSVTNCELVCQASSETGRIRVQISSVIVEQLFSIAAVTQQVYVRPAGFFMGETPISYIKEFHREAIIEHLKQFLLNYRIMHLVRDELLSHKIHVIGSPRLITIDFDFDQGVVFDFEFSRTESVSIQDWRYFSFKAPKRKNYKDLDRQVEFFIAEEMGRQMGCQSDAINLRDWIFFEITILDYNQNPLIDGFSQRFWFRVGCEEVENSLRDIFLGKKKGDSIITDDRGLQDYFSSLLQTHYLFRIDILDVVPSEYFDFDLFKHSFKLKTNKDMHKKLIEVFSFRNDISQRRLMVEDALKLLISKHKVVAPPALVLRQKNKLIRAMSENPDYNVYRRQHDFERKLHELAEKQASELVFMDQFVLAENLSVTEDDVKGYINLMKRNRTKDFLYFDVPESTFNGHEVPVPFEEFKAVCLREKGINYAIYHLTKK